MLKGKVIGQIWATRHVEDIPRGALLDIELDTGSRLVAFDPLSCAKGENVLIATGSVAAGYFEEKSIIEAVVIASIDKQST